MKKILLVVLSALALHQATNVVAASTTHPLEGVKVLGVFNASGPGSAQEMVKDEVSKLMHVGKWINTQNLSPRLAPGEDTWEDYFAIKRNKPDVIIIPGLMLREDDIPEIATAADDIPIVLIGGATPDYILTDKDYSPYKNLYVGLLKGPEGLPLRLSSKELVHLANKPFITSLDKTGDFPEEIDILLKHLEKMEIKTEL